MNGLEKKNMKTQKQQREKKNIKTDREHQTRKNRSRLEKEKNTYKEKHKTNPCDCKLFDSR